ncbi:MAG TPA: hypothetical protein VF911_21280, partial [Thermoanaerobaculia bacterium]
RSLARSHGDIEEVIHELEGRISENPVAAVGQHGDYRVDNIFIGVGRVDVTSFGAFREGLPLEDIAQFLLDLEVRFDSMLGRRRIAKLRDAFLDGYGTKYEELDRDALRLFTITKALHMLAHGGYDRRTHATLRRIIRRSMAE